MNIKINSAEETVIKSALIDYRAGLVGQGIQYNTISDILNKINNAGILRAERTPRVFLDKQYMFTFEEGGWNTVWAKTKKGAIRAAILEYKNDESLNVKLDSVHLATKKGIDSAMSLFY